MRTTGPARIIPLLPLLRVGDVHRFMDALRHNLPTPQPGVEPLFCLWLQLPSRVFPSSWGSISAAYSPLSAPKLDATPDSTVLTASEMDELKRWFGAGLIRFMPVGYAGALLSVLSAEEIRSELDWSLSNPWRNGIKDNFGQSSSTVIPFWPDSQRAKIINESGSRYDYCALGIYAGPDTQEWLVFTNAEPELRLFALPTLYAGSAPSAFSLQHRIESCLAQTANQGDLVLRLDIGEDFSGLGAVITTLEQCGRQGHTGVSLVDPLPLSETGIVEQQDALLHGKLSSLLSIAPFMNPDFRGHISRLPEGRRARSATQERLKTQLIATVPVEEASPLETRLDPPTRQRNLLAAMQGSVAILSNDFEARFREGRFSGFFPIAPGGNKDDGIRFIAAPGLGIRVRDEILFSETESAVSIESDYAHGLRETMVLKAPQTKIPARMYVDFLLVDHSPHLLLDVQIRYPWLQSNLVVEELRPFQLSIELGAGVNSADVLYRRHDGTWNTNSITLPRSAQHISDRFGVNLKLPFINKKDDAISKDSWQDDTTRHLFGSSWVFSWTEGGRTRGLELSRLPSEAGQSIPLEAQLRRDRKHRSTVLDIFPEGRFFAVKAEELNTLNQHFTLAVYPFFDAKSERPTMDTSIDRDISPFYLLRTQTSADATPPSVPSTPRVFNRQM